MVVSAIDLDRSPHICVRWLDRPEQVSPVIPPFQGRPDLHQASRRGPHPLKLGGLYTCSHAGVELRRNVAADGHGAPAHNAPRRHPTRMARESTCQLPTTCVLRRMARPMPICAWVLLWARIAPTTLSSSFSDPDLAQRFPSRCASRRADSARAHRLKAEQSGSASCMARKAETAAVRLKPQGNAMPRASYRRRRPASRLLPPRAGCIRPRSRSRS